MSTCLRSSFIRQGKEEKITLPCFDFLEIRHRGKARALSLSLSLFISVSSPTKEDDLRPVIAPTNPLSSTSTSFSNPRKLLQWRPPGSSRIQCSAFVPPMPFATAETVGTDAPMTGGSYEFSRAATSLTEKLLDFPKKVTIVRHGLSSWNEESRVQGSSNLSVLTETGVMQAERCKAALSNRRFDGCFSSPLSRAKTTAASYMEREG